MHYMLSAGEVSGDNHGAALVKALKELDEGASFTFLGGDGMAEATGKEPVVHISQMAYMGFSEVLRHLGDIRENMRKAKEALSGEHKPDALILIDYPSFNLKLAKEAVKQGIPVFYFIPPKVWAWKQWRIKSLRKLCTAIYSILPFEPEFYKRHGMKVDYIGNPSVAQIDEAKESAIPVIADHPILALLPGSRMGEIRNNLPVMAEAARRVSDRLTPVIVGAPGIEDSVYQQYAPDWAIYRDGTAELLASATVALVTSGTATLECALIGTPQVACYRSNGSRIAYEVMKRVLSVDYVTLPNLIVDDEAIPEMLLHKCTPELLAEEIEKLMPGCPAREEQLVAYARMRTILGSSPAAYKAASSIIKTLKTKQA